MLDSGGRMIRRLQPTRRDGLNRVTWDLRYEPTREVALRTTPPTNPHVWEEKRFAGERTRPILYYGIGQTRLGPLVVPGTYTVKLAVDGREQTQAVEVLKDPNTTGTLDDIRKQHDLLYAIHGDINTVADTINEIEILRKQIEDLPTSLGSGPRRAAVLKEASALDAQLLAVRDVLMQRTARGQRRQVVPRPDPGLPEADVAGGRSRVRARATLPAAWTSRPRRRSRRCTTC